MSKPVRIDFVSDVVCPWCTIGLGGLEEALTRLDGVVQADIHFQPFELNPDMAPEGEDIVEHIGKKYGSSADQFAQNREMIRERAAQVGFTMTNGQGTRIYNTFDAHRLLHWAGTVNLARQAALKHALFDAFFTEERNVADAEVLAAAAEKAGLDGAEAREVLSSGRYAEDVRAAEQQWRMAGISAVPAIVINRKYLISGGQPAEAFEEALRNIALQDAAQG